MNKALIRSHMMKNNDTQSKLAVYLGLSRSCLNAKINETRGAEFKQNEIMLICRRYNLSPEDVDAIFFTR